ncbi:MAG TPA: hypothetical protein VGY56_02425 [Verrucomicrobiae bacterium]|nr:hypothetical protein [Verrucomicrobiae bacterium]
MKAWTDSILTLVRQLPHEFSTTDVYAYERQLQHAHPQNRNVRAKIRQQLQILRDRGFLKQSRPGHWTKTSVPKPTTKRK